MTDIDLDAIRRCYLPEMLGAINDPKRACECKEFRPDAVSVDGDWLHLAGVNFTAVVDEVERLRTELAPAPCVMTWTPPMDFGQCETHDETFPLGGKCRFDGREVWEVFSEEADEQRQRAMRAEMELDRLIHGDDA